MPVMRRFGKPRSLRRWTGEAIGVTLWCREFDVRMILKSASREMAAMTLFGSDTLKDTIGQTRDKWGWFVALGVVLLIFGIIAFGNLFIATVASVFVVGWLMLMAGIIEILHAFGVKTWGRFFYWLLS